MERNVLNINGNSLLETGYQGSDYTCYDPLGCLDISCDGGSWQQEVSWTISDVDEMNYLWNAPYEGPSSVIIRLVKDFGLLKFHGPFLMSMK